MNNRPDVGAMNDALNQLWMRALVGYGVFALGVIVFMTVEVSPGLWVLAWIATCFAPWGISAVRLHRRISLVKRNNRGRTTGDTHV